MQLTLTDHQQAQLNVAAYNGSNIGILGGGPGTGKTYTAAAMIKRELGQVGYDGICVCAPTGKAAVRISEVMDGYEIPLRAHTIHRTLGPMVEDGEFFFQYGPGNPLPHKLIVLDEGSMPNTDLMCDLFAARAPGCKVVIVGDTNQLPPVGHGAPLRDMIAAGIPYGELTEPQRHDGGIVDACHAIRRGEEFQVGGNLHHTHSDDSQFIIDNLTGLLDQKAGQGYDKVWDCQPIVAVNKQGDLCRKKLNGILQKYLNSNQAPSGSPFAVDDKVVCLKNSWLPPAKDCIAPASSSDWDEIITDDKEQVYVANGELAKVLVSEPRYFECRLESPVRHVRVPRGKRDDDEHGTGCDWDLGYALSCHKMQGSEVKNAIVVLDDSPAARHVGSREWFYTAISRAKEHTHLIGKLSVAREMCRKVAIGKRKTFLKELIEA